MTDFNLAFSISIHTQLNQSLKTQNPYYQMSISRNPHNNSHKKVDPIVPLSTTTAANIYAS